MIFTGTANVTNGSPNVTVTGFTLSALVITPDVVVSLDGDAYFLDSITNTTTLVLTRDYDGPNGTVPVEISTISETSASNVDLNAKTATLLEELLDFDPLNNLDSLSAIEGSGVIYQGATGEHELLAKADLTQGVDVDARVQTLAERDAYDNRPADFSVYVNDIGNGRAAVYFKLSNTIADWSTPAYQTGPVGPVADLEFEIVNLPPGSDPTISQTDIPGGYEVTIGLPAAEGFYFQGVYDIGLAYNKDDVVWDNGSSFIALQPVPVGEGPNSVYPPTDNAYWAVLAAKGQDGTGTGDVVGPPSSVNNRVAVFDGTTGKLLKDGGQTIAQILANAAPADYSDLQFTVSQLAMIAADLTNQAQFLGPNGNRFADSFDTLTYVDVAGATNLNSSISGLLKPTISGGPSYSNPGGTGNRTSSIATSTTFTGSGTVDNLVDGAFAANSTDSISLSGGQATGKYFRFDFGTAKLIDEVTWRQSVAVAQGTWKIQASNSESSGYIDIGSSFALGTSTVQVIPLSGNVTPYRYWQMVYVSGTYDNAAWYQEIEFKIADGPATANNLTVRSTAFTASAVPTKMKALINVREVEAAVAGTDYFLDCSRDGGTTWAAMALTERYTSGNLRVVEAAETDVSGQPSGSSPRWRFRTVNNKNVELHDVYLYWTN